MSDDEAVKALREFTALRDTTREFVVDGIEPPRGFLDDTGGHAAARSLLSAAPALLARIETGEGLLAAMQARAEKAEASDTARLKLMEEALAAFSTERTRAVKAEVALAEAAPVVEAAEACASDWDGVDSVYPLHETCKGRALRDALDALDKTVAALRAARSLRGAGEGDAEARKGEETKRG